MAGLRSQGWFVGDDDIALEHRAALRAAGIPVPGDRQPVIGVLSSISDLNPCNLPLRAAGAAVKAGVSEAGGIAVELPVMSLGEDLMKPSAMLYRNLLSIEAEEYIRSNPLDGVVLLGNCDKTIPALLMAAASADVPAVLVSGGYRRPGSLDGHEVAAGTDLWKSWDQRRAGHLSDERWRALEKALGCSQGACNVMGTAMTMAILTETLGMMIPGASTLAFNDERLTAAATDSGRRIVTLVEEKITPAKILTPAAFTNALLVLAAIGGSTNAIVHLCAIAGRRNIRLALEDFDRAAASVPVLADILPAGRHTIAAFDAAGGVPALLHELREVLDFAVTTIHPDGLLAQAAPAPTAGSAIHPIADPVSPPGGLVVLRGTLAPDGAVLKAAAASPALLQHTGPAVVFHGYHDMLKRIDDPDLDVTPDSVLILTGCGPRGGDGFPEWGMIPIPRVLAAQGVRDMLRISDARMSGTSYGTCILHTAPEAAIGGPLALVRTGDLIRLDTVRRRLDLLLPGEEVQQRRAQWRPAPSAHTRGWPRLYEDHVLQAPDGADLDFLRPARESELRFVEPTLGRS